MFFFPRIVASLGDPSTIISYLALETLQGTQVHHLRLQPPPPSQIDTTGALSQIAVKDFYVDATTFLLVKIQDQAYRVDTTTDSLPHTISFSNYQAVNGVLVPFALDETIDGIRVSHVEISSLNFNVGLTDSAFDLTQ